MFEEGINNEIYGGLEILNQIINKIIGQIKKINEKDKW